jgi:hypothetical protein
MRPLIISLVAALGMAAALPARADLVSDATIAYQQGHYQRAEALYRQLAEQGYVVAYSVLGVMYAQGQGVKQDYAEAARWYQVAAEQGIAASQSALAGLYFTGRGVPRDVDTALYWYIEAGRRGDMAAQFHLGTLYETGQGGIPVDYERAARWYRYAAERGNPSARFNLAGLYERGQGVPQDDVRAYMWLDLAASGGWRHAEKERNRLAKGMTAQQIVEARQLRQSCQTSGFRACE